MFGEEKPTDIFGDSIGEELGNTTVGDDNTGMEDETVDVGDGETMTEVLVKGLRAIDNFGEGDTIGCLGDKLGTALLFGDRVSFGEILDDGNKENPCENFGDNF